MLRNAQKFAAKKPSRGEILNPLDGQGGAALRAENAAAAKANRETGGITEEQLEEYFESRTAEGQGFRRCLLFLFLFLIVFLVLLKWDKESMVAELETAKERFKNEEGKDMEDEYYDTLGINKDEAKKDKKAKMEEAKKKLEEMEKSGEDAGGQLATLKSAYNALSTQVENDYHEVLNIPKRASYHTVKKAYEKAKKAAEEGESKYELAEIKEAFDIMSHPEARTYYNLYAAKPPEMIKHQQKATHGGWGVEIGMGTFKYVVLKEWLSYFNSGWVETSFFGLIFVVLCVKLWNNKDELLEKMEQIEAMERMAQEEREAAKAKAQ